MFELYNFPHLCTACVAVRFVNDTVIVFVWAGLSQPVWALWKGWLIWTPTGKTKERRQKENQIATIENYY